MKRSLSICAVLLTLVPSLARSARPQTAPASLGRGLPRTPAPRWGLAKPPLAAPARSGLPPVFATPPSAAWLQTPSPLGPAATPGLAAPSFLLPAPPTAAVQKPLRRLAAGLPLGAVFDGTGIFGALNAADPTPPEPSLGVLRYAGTSDLGPSGSGSRPRSRAVPSASEIPGRTPLERHAAFFDENGDGVITLWETRRALRRLGLGVVRSAAIAALIHAGLSPLTAEGILDVALLRIRVRNIHKGIHASDSGVYDARGNFVPAEFDRMFDQFSKSRPDHLNEAEIRLMIEANAARKPGWLGKLVSAKGEFGLLLEFAADSSDRVDGRTVRAISRQRLMAFYDGTLFYQLTR